jgi:hypothetical protein
MISTFFSGVVPTYEQAFPALGGGSSVNAGGAWTNTVKAQRIRSSEVSITFSIPNEERRHRPGIAVAGAEFGKGTAADRGKLEASKIMTRTGTKVNNIKILKQKKVSKS